MAVAKCVDLQTKHAQGEERVARSGTGDSDVVELWVSRVAAFSSQYNSSR